ncbi:replication protein [Shewanella japonica]|uniref:Replication protein n=2 Tax=Shewanella japonica TaxID=93973 RepID=A0ABM6JM32_9GAMM|nr:replication protein [Shewanella japonica]
MLYEANYNKQWVEKRLYGLPDIHKKAVMQRYKKKPTKQQANLYILAITKAIAEILGSTSHIYIVNIEGREYEIKAKYHARQCINICRRLDSQSLFTTYKNIEHYLKAYQIKPPVLSETVLANLQQDTLSESELSKVVGVLNRAIDESWWKPKLRKLHNRQIETISRLLNQVNEHKGIYASNVTVSNFKTQWQSNRELLENTIATNEHDYSMSLAELSDLNVSNPKIRKAELMVRIRGFEDYAKDMGYSALFLTMTTPSKYHRSYSKSGAENPKWNGATPLDGQDYLNRTFQRIRASLNRDNITPFGFRIAEPHHDGTPHWHILYFVPTEHQDRLVETFEHYCFEEDGDENGAKKHRFEVEYIDPEKGSATGYIVKYVSKSIDGEGIEHDSYGKEATDSAVRIKVWASCWGIRQFQQIGGVGVTQWRELRRLSAITDESLDWVETVRQAADESNWSKYTELMGGVFCKREDQLIRPLYQLKKQSTQPVTKTVANNESNIIVNNDSCKPYINTRDTAHQCTMSSCSHIARTPIHHAGFTKNYLSRIAEPFTEMSAINLETVSAIPAICAESNPAMITEIPRPYPAYSCNHTVNSHQGNIYKTNRYGDEFVIQLKGIVALGVEIITRVHEWTLTQSSPACALDLTWSSVNKCTVQ